MNNTETTQAAAHKYVEEISGQRDLLLSNHEFDTITFVGNMAPYSTVRERLTSKLGRPVEAWVNKSGQKNTMWFLDAEGNRRVHIQESSKALYALSLIDLNAE